MALSGGIFVSNRGFSFVWEKVLPLRFNFDSAGFIIVVDDAVFG